LGALVGLMGLVMAVSACQLDGLPVAAVIDGPHGLHVAAMLDLGTLGGGDSQALAVDGKIVVGTSGGHAFAYDLNAPRPEMLDLGTLGGPTSKASAVDGKVVVGTSDTSSTEGTSHAFAYDLNAPHPVMVDLGTLGGPSSEASAVRGKVVVGSSRTTDGSFHAFAYDLNSPHPAMLDLATFGGADSEARAVDGKIVVGGASTTDGSFHAFAYDLNAPHPALLDLGTVPGSFNSSYASAVDGKIVVGTSGGRAFAYDLNAPHPAMLDLGSFGFGFAGATGVSGTIVVGQLANENDCCHGFVYDLKAQQPILDLGFTDTPAVDDHIVVGGPDTDNHGFAYDLKAQPPAKLDLGTLAGGSFSAAVAVAGKTVVGFADTSTDFHTDHTHAVAWLLR
jgi:probable HAF family extracellular repeat protein